ncbi:MAG TPA: hypothetical protein VGX69_10730 [Solirubrobacteraceae bacterium]|jgi:hypothetical protein|nr:hypothetical protein [Solirubrobacteraceae bacterium]
MPSHGEHGTRRNCADIEIRYPDGHVVYIEVKAHGNEIDVRDAENELMMHIGGASSAFVGAASVSGWYVRSGSPPWSEDADAAGISADWRTVGEDLWRALGRATYVRIKGDPDQSCLFDPADLERNGA